jgi:Ca-activated chloride channel homolog
MGARMRARPFHWGTAFGVLALAGLAALTVEGARLGWTRLWSSPDQQGRWLYDHGRYAEAAETFVDPRWRGAAQMRGGDFKAAAETYLGAETAGAAYDRGNALVMLGKYEDAAKAYDRALALRPGWREAEDNLTLARLRAERMKAPGTDAEGQREGADEIVYDKAAARNEGQKTETPGTPMDDSAVRALWLKRVQTKPADFLRARFAYQLQSQGPTDSHREPPK